MIPFLDPHTTMSASVRGTLRTVAALTLVVLLGCGAPESTPRLVAASLPPVGFLVEAVTGDAMQVITLLPSGRSPHDYEPSPAELGRLQGASLFVYADDAVDGWMQRAAQGVLGARGATLAMAPAGFPGDPHRWLDLESVRRFLPRLAESLAALDPAGAEGYRARAAALADSLDAFDRRARSALADCPEIPFALSHPAFLSLVEGLGRDPVGILQADPEGEARPRTLGETARALEARGGGVIFVEPQLAGRTAEALAGDTEARVAVLDPLGGAGIPGRSTYLELLAFNLAALVEAFCEPGS